MMTHSRRRLFIVSFEEGNVTYKQKLLEKFIGMEEIL